jgi:ankyrin repeat protein
VLMMASLQTEFLRVCETGDLERVKQLLGEGVDINTQNHVCVFDEFVF